MKDGIHPAYGPVLFYDTAADTYVLTRSTRTSTETKLWSDGNTYPLVRVDISAASHPFWTGGQRIVDTAGRVEKFRRRYGTRARTRPDGRPEAAHVPLTDPSPPRPVECQPGPTHARPVPLPARRTHRPAPCLRRVRALPGRTGDPAVTSRPERADLGPRRLPERSPSTRGTVSGDPHGRLDGAAGHRRDAAAAADGQSVLLVGVCSGRRCAALRRLDSANPHATGSSRDGDSNATYPESEELVRQAIRDRRQAVLVSLPCLGPCSEASVTALGAASAGPHSLTWLGRPSLFGLTQTPERARALADWIAADAPNPHSLPTPLRRRI